MDDKISGRGGKIETREWMRKRSRQKMFVENGRHFVYVG